MLHRSAVRLVVALVVTAFLVAPAAADPVNSDLASATLGGDCYPTALAPSLLDMLTLINPEWAPVAPLTIDTTHVATTPVLVHGEVEEMHGDLSGDFPSTHLRADVNHFVRPDPEDAGLLGTGNDDGRIHFEWEAGVYPAWAWAGAGDRLVGLGRWIWDCGHPGAIPGACAGSPSTVCVLNKDCPSGDTCVGTHYAYSSELHPPYATAAIRRGRGGIVSTRSDAIPIPATRADVYVSNQAGGAGDACVITHLAHDLDELSVECWPLSQPVATVNDRDFAFDLPLPPRPAGARRALWRVVSQPTPGGTPARLKIHRRLADPDPHLQVIVRLAHPTKGAMPTGFAGTIYAGWRHDPTPLVHVRVTLTDLVVNNALQPANPSVPRTCSSNDAPCATAAECPSGDSCFGAGPVKSWAGQIGVNGEWQELVGLSSVDTGAVVPQGLVWEQYLPSDGIVHVEANGRSHECIDTMYGKSLATGLNELGFNKGIVCLATNARDIGSIDLTYAGPDFGAGSGGSTDYVTVTAGGAGGYCSVDTGLLCTVDGDCPSGETCVATGGAATLRYRIERLS
jgi:hypothetical protein